MKGTVKEARGHPNPNNFEIEGEDKKTYFAHLGDIKDNEDLLYKLYSNNKTASLQKGDTVEFEPVEHRPRTIHAIHVKKVA